MTRLERTARDAAERIQHLKEEKRALEKRLSDMETLFAQERQNFDQRASLIESVKTESQERAKEFTNLSMRLNDQDRLLNEQIEIIAKLESELENRSVELQKQQKLETTWKSEVSEWKDKFAQLEERLNVVSAERDKLRQTIYEDERMDAQYVLHLTPDDRDKAAKVLDALMDQLSTIESRALLTNEK